MLFRSPFQSIDGVTGLVPRCNCGRTGDLESLCSLTAITNSLLPYFLRQYPGHELGRVDASQGAKRVRGMAERGDAMCRDIFRVQAHALGLFFDMMINTFDPDALIIGGGDGGMFMRLFRHIERNDVKMTAPVEMTLPKTRENAGADGTAMAFLYANPQIGTTGPDPADGNVVVEDVPALKVASVGIRGGYGPDAFARGEELVRGWLREHPEWEEAGSPRALAYNSPFVPGMLKYAEVQIGRAHV